MIRRSFLKGVGLIGAIDPLQLLAQGEAAAPGAAAPTSAAAPDADRAFWVETLDRIASPVLRNLARGQLHANMPVEQKPTKGPGRAGVTHLESFGRTMTGIAPWLELGADESAEGRLRRSYADLARRSLAHAVDPRSPDHMNFSELKQPLVDAAFLAHAIVKAPRTLVDGLDPTTRRQLGEALVAARAITPYDSNWLLFSAMVEMGLLRLGERWDAARVEQILGRFEEFYLGDGAYGDGPEFHWDYYNSFVMHPFLLDILATLKERESRYTPAYERQVTISQRYGVVLERMIAPDGTYPLVGRSVTYRFGAFQLLAQLALRHQLLPALPPGQVRSALTAVIRKIMSAPGLFDRQGWLRIGVYGAQPSLGEDYISTGSLYLCTAVFQPLGLPATDPFWSEPAQDWTSRKAWSGGDVPADHALDLPRS